MRDAEREILEVVLAGAGDDQFRGTESGERRGRVARLSFGGGGHGLGPRECGREERGGRGDGAEVMLGRAFRDDLAAGRSGLGADLENPIGGL